MIYSLLFCLFFPFIAHAGDFDELMGKGTKHWHYLTQQRDIALLDGLKELYERQKHKQFAEVGSYTIPPIIHFIWLGPRQFPPESVQNVRTWMAMHPGWTVKFWTDRSRLAPCVGMQIESVSDFTFSSLEKCYRESENWGEKSDILRYEILLQQGGVYVDHDANCLKPFESLHKGYDFYCGLEAPHEPFVGRNITCGNGVIGSRPGHPSVARVIELVKERWEPLKSAFRGKDAYSKSEIVMRRTYIALTDSLADTIDRCGNSDIVLPSAYFFAKSGIESLYSHHFYATRWDESREKKSPTMRFNERIMHKLAHDIGRVSLCLWLFLGFNLIIFSYILLKMKKR